MRNKTKSTINSYLVPKPVHPKAIQDHGFLGKTFVKQHMILDDRWTTNSITDEFGKMTELLNKRLQFNNSKKEVILGKCFKKYYTLRKQCNDGRTHLKRIRAGDTQGVRNILKDHRLLQRLYQKMPLHMVDENLDQRSFVMRKERDRLQCRLEQLEKIYSKKLLQKSSMENRINYQNEFVLDEEIKSQDLEKKISNSRTRLEAILAINATYKKIIQILHHDEIFYEPILQSLDKDIKDQTHFIKHILFLGSPALVHFKELSEQYTTINDKSRKSMHLSIQQCSSYRKIDPKHHQREAKPSGDIFYKVGRYVRETRSMQELKTQLEGIEDIIKKIKFATLCSREKDIYPRIKSQIDNNLKLMTKIDNDMLTHEALETKMKCANVLEGVLTNNLADDTLMRLEKIREIKDALKVEDDFQEKTLSHIKRHSDIFVLLRFSLWNIHDIMRHVGPKRMPFSEYKVDYLKLPLLKYEMLNMTSCPPDPFEENITTLLKVVQRKLRLLMNIFDNNLRHSTINKLRNSYCTEILSANDDDVLSAMDSQAKLGTVKKSDAEVDLMEEVKAYSSIPNRKQIKLASARLVDEFLKRD